jgi:hypothetical protein
MLGRRVARWDVRGARFVHATVFMAPANSAAFAA